MSEKINSTLSFGEDLFKSLVWDPMIDAAVLALNWPWPLNAIAGVIAKFIGDKIFSVTRMNIDVAAIGLRNGIYKEAFVRESIKLKMIADQKGPQSEEFKQAKEDAKRALSKFVSYSV